MMAIPYRYNQTNKDKAEIVEDNISCDNKGVFWTKQESEIIESDPFTIHDTIYETITSHVVIFEGNHVPKYWNVEE